MGVSDLSSIKNPGYFVFLNAKTVHFANASTSDPPFIPYGGNGTRQAIPREE